MALVLKENGDIGVDECLLLINANRRIPQVLAQLQDKSDLVLDLSALSGDSSCLLLMIEIVRFANRNKKSLVWQNIPEPIQSLIDLYQINSIINE